MMKPLAIWAVVAVVLAGCSGLAENMGFNKQSETAAADPKIYPSHYREQVAEFMRTYLSNPSRIKEASISEPALQTVAGVPHYVLCVRYNPRGADNRYEGLQTKRAIFLGGNLAQFLEPEGDSCKTVAYQRFPMLETLVP